MAVWVWPFSWLILVFLGIHTDMGSLNPWAQWRLASTANDPQLVVTFWSEHQNTFQMIAQKWLDRMLERTTANDSASTATAFEVFCMPTNKTRNESLRGADELWRLTAAIVMCHQQGNDRGTQADGKSGPDPTGDVSSAQQASAVSIPTNLAELLTGELLRLLKLLADVDLEVVVIAKLCGATDEALGAEMAYTRRTIQRMLRLIRSIWQDELDSCRSPLR